MTPEQVNQLTDVELNRAMIWLYPEEYSVSRCPESIWYWRGMLRLDYLEDWNLTMPLAVETGLDISFPRNNDHIVEVKTLNNLKWYISNNKNPLRAICEVLVMIKLEEE